MEINGRVIGHDQPCYIIAEVGANHGQDLGTAVEMIEMAAAAGADAVKVQHYLPEDAAGDDADKLAFYKTTCMDWDWMYELQSKAETHNITLFSTPASVAAVEFLEGYDVPAYKIASCDSANYELMLAIKKTGKPVILSTGMCEWDDIGTALLVLPFETAVLHCNSAYPTPDRDANLNTLSHLVGSVFNPVGYSDHTIGYTIPLAAVARGACIIEKHFYLEGTDPIDKEFSIDHLEFGEMVRNIRRIEEAIGEVRYGYTESEEACRWLKELKSGTQE